MKPLTVSLLVASIALLSLQAQAVPFDTPLSDILDPNHVHDTGLAPPIDQHRQHNPSVSKPEKAAAFGVRSAELHSSHSDRDHELLQSKLSQAHGESEEEKEDGYLDELFRTIARPQHPFGGDLIHDGNNKASSKRFRSPTRGRRPGPEFFPRRIRKGEPLRDRLPKLRPPPPGRSRSEHEDHSQLPPPPPPAAAPSRFPLYPGVGRPPFEPIPRNKPDSRSPSTEHRHHADRKCHERPHPPHFLDSPAIHRFLRISHHPFFHLFLTLTQLGLGVFVVVMMWKSWIDWKSAREGTIRLEGEEADEKDTNDRNGVEEVAVEGETLEV